MIYQTGNMGLECHHDIRYYRSCNFMTHMHSDFELLIMLSGIAELLVNDHEYTLTPPSMVLVHSNQAHSIRMESGSEMLIHVFSPDVTGSFFKESSGKIGESAIFMCEPQVRDMYIDTVFIRRDFSEYTLKGCLYLIISSYLKSVKLTDRCTQQNHVLSAVFAYISTHFTEKITLDNIAAECGYSQSYISRIFSETVGLNIKRFVNSYRLDYARELLKTTNMTITEAAMASGFGSVRNFNRAFSDEYNTQPRTKNELELKMGTYESEILYTFSK